MKTLAVVLFVAVVGAVAIHLARRPTVADGRVMEADLLGQLRAQGVTGMACEPRIPIGRDGATFSCVATLESGATQTLAYTMDRQGQLAATLTGAAGTGAAGTGARPAAPDRKRAPSNDPWAN
ncbi:MAG TPA: hypothetical protein VFP84_22125 [Kofleriaceae bacterium]|nr:hypothetical protein [Kofleriaceae bacterium]